MENKELDKIQQDETIVPLPTKEEVIEILKKENQPIDNNHKYSQMILILEIKKVKENVGILKGEYYKGDTVEYKGSLLLPLGKPNPNSQSQFDGMNVGEYKFFGFTLDSREEKLPEKVLNFFKRSFEDATLQDFIPFTGGKKQND
ncbi:MAG: hypothetical protein KKH52_03650 [Nanoarchaeota archaeon]|nr:hypothetical protein [Nanoarchaeota archaeon]MBU1622427.1 hypothetical protein [Nanoarchaeota archaeon]MBU1974462.1 hypothetical protein [Nanoarchaeota archaeon]